MSGRSIRLHVRTKKRYEPAYFASQLWYIDVTDFAGCSVGDIKKKCHKETAAKVDDLFFLNQSLADDRSVAHYNFPDGAILETTSNPLWVAMIHVKMVEIERERDAHPDDHHVQRWTHRSYAKKTTLLSVLFNAKKLENVQPPNFPVYEDFIFYLERLGRKGANINPAYSGKDFQRWFAEHLQLDVDKADPIRAFQTRHAARLSLTPDQGQSTGKKQKNNGNPPSKERGKGKQLVRRVSATATPARPARQERLCEDCEENRAEIYCNSCVGSGGSAGVVLCLDCTHRIHQGALRGSHDCKDISQAPKTPAAPRQYLPHPYKAPFAILLAMTRALQENEHKLSLNEEEIKQRAQPVTDTDLHDKPIGKMMGGFDCIENTLIPKRLVQKEAADRHTFALTQSGRELGQKLDIFDDVMLKFLADTGVPRPPSNFRSRVGGQQVALVMDGRERDAARMTALARKAGITILVRSLQVADYIWVLSPNLSNASVPYDGSQPDQEIMLPVLVERKSWHDLHDSVRLGRWTTQINRMKACRLLLNFLLVEGCLTDMRQVSQERRDFLQAEVERLCMEEGFHVGRTFSWAKSATWLFWMTNILTEAFSQGLFEGETIMFNELSSRMVRGQREMRVGGIIRPLTSRGYSCVWDPDRMITAIFRDSLGEQTMTETYRQEFCSADVRQLLVLQNLEVYNKNRQNLLLSALRQASSLETYTRDSVRGVVEDQLMGDLKGLVHYDVLGFWILSLQVRHQVFVMRTETEEDTQRLQHWFSNIGSASGEREKTKTDEEKIQNNVGKKKKDEEKKDMDRKSTMAVGGSKDQGREAERGSTLDDDFVLGSQSEERMLQEALSLSLMSSMECDNEVESAIPPVPLSHSVHHHQLSEQADSLPLFETFPSSARLWQQRDRATKAGVSHRLVSLRTTPFSRSESPLGLTQDDAILIYSQGYESRLGLTQDDAILIDSQGYHDEIAGVEVESSATQDGLNTVNLPIKSEKTEMIAETLQAEECQIVTKSTMQEDEELARRLQAEENMKDLKGVKRGEGVKVLRCKGVECGQCEGCERKQEDVNRNTVHKDRTNLKSTLDGAVADDVNVLASAACSQNRKQSLCVLTALQSPSRKRPAPLSGDIFLQSLSESMKKCKTQLESDEELARRLQRELDNSGPDKAESASLDNHQPASDIVDTDAALGFSLSREDLLPQMKEEDQIMAQRLQEEEMLGLSVDSSGLTQSDDMSHDVIGEHCRYDSFLSDEALARKLQEEEEGLPAKTPHHHTHTSTPASKKNTEFLEHRNKKSDKGLQKWPKLETSYVENDEELARRLQEQEEEEIKKSQMLALSPVLTHTPPVKRGRPAGLVDVSLEDEHRARKFQEEQEVGVSGHTEQGTVLGTQIQAAQTLDKQDGHKTACRTSSDLDTLAEKKPDNLKTEPEPCINTTGTVGHGVDINMTGTVGHGVDINTTGTVGHGVDINTTGTVGHGVDINTTGTVGHGVDIKSNACPDDQVNQWSTASEQPPSSSREENTDLCPAESTPATIISNVKCGSCGQKGHNRRFDRCPNYYTEKEKKRRDAMEEAHRRRVEERARDAEERQREEQRALARLAVTRDVLQHNKEQMMQQIAAAAQECASQFQSQLNDIDRLITSKERKLKTGQAKQRRQ